MGCSLKTILYPLTAVSNPRTTVSARSGTFPLFGTEEAVILLGSVLICIWSEPSFSLVQSGEQKQSTYQIASVCCSDGGTEHRKPTICFT